MKVRFAGGLMGFVPQGKSNLEPLNGGAIVAKKKVAKKAAAKKVAKKKTAKKKCCKC